MRLFIEFTRRYRQNILFVCIVLVFLSSYFRVPFLFFQQDETLGFGLFIKEGWSTILNGFGAGSPIHFVPLTMFLSYSIFKFFGLNYYVYNILGLVFHLTNGVLVYCIAKLFLKKKNSALVAGLVFFSSSVAAQLIMWPVINLNSISLTFSLLAWLAVVKKKLFWVPILFLCAVFSVEYSAGLIFFIPVAIFLTLGKGIKKKVVKTIPFGLVTLGYGLFRLLPIVTVHGASLGVLAGSERHSFLANVFNLITRYFGQLFFGQDILLFISKAIQKVVGLSNLGTAYAEISIFPVASLLLGIFLIAFSLFVYRRIKKEGDYSKGFLLSFAFIVFSSLPFLLVPGGARLSSIISSRYMYFGLAGMALFMAYVFEMCFGLKRKIISYAVIGVVLLMVVVGTLGNVNRADKLYRQGRLRLEILNTIKSKYSSLPEKVAFYIESDKSYYGLPPEAHIPPFQSGFGQTLLVWYYPTENFSQEFYKNQFLWGIMDQGYEEKDGRGFGYFRDFGKLVKVIEVEKLPVESVISFRYDSDSQILTDNTDEVRGRLKGYFSDKQKINPQEIDIFASTNPKEAGLMLDGKRDTFWDSELPYALPQFVQIKLSSLKKVAAISIDSYNNKDQNEVGYAVYLSEDGNAWEEVFYSKRYPPGEDGMVNIYLLPKLARFVKIQQVGHHKYASWVIHELKIYEVKN